MLKRSALDPEILAELEAAHGVLCDIWNGWYDVDDAELDRVMAWFEKTLGIKRGGDA